MSTAPHVVVGGGQAAAAAVEELRRRGFAGPVVLVTEETEHPYRRPPLSKEYLSDGADDELRIQPAQWYRDHGIEVALGVRATAVDPRAQVVGLSDGTEVGYEKLCNGKVDIQSTLR